MGCWCVMVSNVEPTVANQPRLLGPCQSVGAGSSGRTSLVELHTVEEEGKPVWCHECGSHLGVKLEKEVVGEQGIGKCKSCVRFCLFFHILPLIALLLHLIVGQSWKYFRPPTCFKFYPIAPVLTLPKSTTEWEEDKCLNVSVKKCLKMVTI